MGKIYIVWNAPMPTTAGIVAVTTGTAIKTLLQLKPAVNHPLEVVGWGISFSGYAAAAPILAELLSTAAINATVTAFAAADIMPYTDPNAPANSAGTSGEPLNLGTAASGYTGSAEGTIVAARVFDAIQLSPMGLYAYQFPLGNRPGILPATFLRVRVTAAAAVNALTYIIFEA